VLLRDLSERCSNLYAPTVVVIKNLLRYIRSDPPDILDPRNTIDIYPDILRLYNQVLNNILKAFLYSNSFNIKNI
jgi:hypothetical protein